ncbi:N-acetylmuramoyl-L-alanine amidase [Metabacillus crassostreae]|uniref:N-acetylmuramoyl-L-alanine amidase n=1 Tax=Metabacillus crassostreae TaxID=929098 RepID=UPI00195CB79F|nr:N-acetylmuramoyl-L-alanine amidase [Metabacillus crassostreae]MBM7605971.1 N-acetylmuramoyl-L-alanine amidase [Metabacillus crassostreae]
MKLVISSGHGKYVSGANSYINEVTEARKIVGKVTNYLKLLSCNVYEFHDNTSKNQTDNINTIVRYHNSKDRDLDVSVHLNAASKTNDPRGVEVLYYGDSNRAIAEKVSVAISRASGLKNRGAKKRTDLGFLKGTIKTALLIEVCFVDSKTDVEIYQSKFNEICKALAESVSGKKIVEKVVKSAQKTNSVQIRTGGLSPEMVEEITKLFKEKGWWAEVQFSTDGKNPTALTGGLSPSMREEMEDWLNARNWWFEIIK